MTIPTIEEWSILTLKLPRNTTRNLILNGSHFIGAIELLSDQDLMLHGQVSEDVARGIRSRIDFLRVSPGADEGRIAIPDTLVHLSIRGSGFSTRATNVFASYGCRVLGHLVGINHDTIMALSNMGARSADEVMATIERLVSSDLRQKDADLSPDLNELPVPARELLPDLPEGCWNWTRLSCKPLEGAAALFEEMEVDTLGELIATVNSRPDWIPSNRLREPYTELREFLASISRCAGRNTLMERDGEFVAPQASRFTIHDSISACLSADEEIDALLQAESERHRSSVLRRWVKRAGRHETLDEIGSVAGVTRERIRQVTERPKTKITQAALRFPRLSAAVEELAAVRRHWKMVHAIEFLSARGHQTSEQTLRLAPTLATIGAIPWIDIDQHDLIVVDATDPTEERGDDITPTVRLVLSRLRIAGWIDESLLPPNSEVETIVTRRLPPVVRGLERIGGAVLPNPGFDVVGLRWVVKVLHLTGAVPVEVLYDRMKRFEENSYGQRLGVEYPSPSAFEGMLRRDSRFLFEGDSVALRPELDSDDPLTPTERAVIGILELLGGTASAAQIRDLATASGHAQSTVALVLQGPCVDKLSHGVYGYPEGKMLEDLTNNAEKSLILTKMGNDDIVESVANTQAQIEAILEPPRSPNPDAEVINRRQEKPMATPIPASERGTLTLPAVALTQDRHRIFLTAIRAGDLQDYTRIDHFKPALPMNDPKQGYQRAEDSPRIKKLGNWLRKQLDESRGVLMPTAILASTRDAKLTYDPERRSVTLHNDAKLWVVDGQHRRAGLNYAIHEKGRDDLRSFEVPLVIVEDLSREEEMTQFAVVNGNQKGVRTDLVNMILTQLTSSRGDEAIEERDQWRVVVSRTVTALNQATGGPWEDLIVMPNEKGWSSKEVEEHPSREHQRVVRATSFMTSLRPIYDYLNASFFAAEDISTAQRAERLATIVSAFWEAIRDLNPKPFEEAGLYVLQKTPGAFALHRLCARLMPTMHLARREWDRENFRIMLEPIAEISDPTYWDAKSGEASKYGSMKGFAELADNLMESRKSGI